MRFYRDGLGGDGRVHEDIAFFPLNGIVLALYPWDKLAEDAVVPADGRGFSGNTIAYNGRSEAEVDAVMRKVEKLGATIVKPAQKVSEGMQWLFC